MVSGLPEETEGEPAKPSSVSETLTFDLNVPVGFEQSHAML